MGLMNREPIVVREEASIYETVQRMIDAPHARSAFVVDDQGQLVGIVTLKDLVNHIFAHRYFEQKNRKQSLFEIVHHANAIELATAQPVCVTRDEPLEEAVQKILDNQLEEIPVIDEEDGNVIGDLNLLELLSVWLESSQKRKGQGRLRDIRLSHYIHKDLICLRLKAKGKDEALEEMFSLLADSPHLPHIQEFRQIVLGREILVTTGVGKGVAIPHGRCSGVHDGVIAAGLSPKGIDFCALDGKPVHIIFMVAAPETAGFPYAQLQARIIQLLNSKGMQKRMLECKDPSEFMSIIEEFDRSFEEPANTPVKN